jgi:hypothetical protein
MHKVKALSYIGGDLQVVFECSQLLVGRDSRILYATIVKIYYVYEIIRPCTVQKSVTFFNHHFLAQIGLTSFLIRTKKVSLMSLESSIRKVHL